ncbi:tellurite resistance/C4-dicarboxylate transporter family protein [Thermomicrobium sp. 4228-Ro]|uniref:tellurite resistance/C4-dicarboxylate transporter family protein n=1 Tax=Thermomicrobium sp. 4228-Ro TaxID=2993937 RepID=UPI0022493E6C|nr:tellurite resistance/C4-dicarboxylate transporter family protein [Thermomicrobium sp. 4228-Ro]MCX2726379.1 tellurite resistance/C4-dicarboxylate transporter family protein [Thermomicrobium sp. 4228-Ro]
MRERIDQRLSRNEHDRRRTRRERRRSARATLVEAVAHLHPAYFALAMATGIVSIAVDLTGQRSIALALFGVNLLAYLILWFLLAWRILRFPTLLARDLADHNRGPGFFTTVAATAVLGRQFLTLTDRPGIALPLWILALLLWILTTYGFFTAITIREDKPSLDHGLHGGWLLTTVATQSLTVLGVPLASLLSKRANVLLFVSITFHLAGLTLYFIVITLIMYRFTFYPVQPDALIPPYWINMGAVAITTLAGATLVSQEAASPLVATLSPVLRGSTWLAWSTGTWWIPLLLLLGVWRHGYKRFAFRYDPQYWGMVFPLGMYAACTDAFARTMHIPFLVPVSHAFAYIALVAWFAVFAGLLRCLFDLLRPR